MFFINYCIILFNIFLFDTPLIDTNKAEKPVNTIEITSQFKPKLMNTSKIKLMNEVMFKDTFKLPFQYEWIDNKPLDFIYKTQKINPVIIDQFETEYVYHNFLSLGAGNVYQPFPLATLGLGLKGKKTLISLRLDNITTNGHLKYQQTQHNNTNIDVTLNNNDWLWHFNANTHYDFVNLYGIQYTKDTFTSSSIPKQIIQHYQFATDAVYKKNEWQGIGKIYFSYFNQNQENSQISPQYYFSLSKTNFSFTSKLALDIDGKHYILKSLLQADTHTYQIKFNPNIYIHNDLMGLYCNMGIGLTTNFAAHFLPQISMYYRLIQNIVKLTVGFNRDLNLNHMAQHYNNNNWFNTTNLFYKNTIKTEAYANISGNWNTKLFYNIQSSLSTLNDYALYTHTALQSNSFNIFYAPQIKQWTNLFELNYNAYEKLSSRISFQHNYFYDLTNLSYAWALSPFEIKWNNQFKFFNDELFLYVNAWYRQGGWYSIITPSSKIINQTKNFIDLSTRVEWNYKRKLMLWLNVNNLLNSQQAIYENYELFRFNASAGFTFYFNVQKYSKQ